MEIIQGVKVALKDMPTVDLLSPFRVHLVEFAETGLKITVVCYFATTSFDEFLYLQQVALLEVARVVSEAGATMTSVLHVDIRDPTLLPRRTLEELVVSSTNSRGTTRGHDGNPSIGEQATSSKINGSAEETSHAAAGTARPISGS